MAWNDKFLGRMAGVFYLVLVVAGGFAHVYVRGAVYFPNDPAATANSVLQNANIVKNGVLMDLFGAVAFLLVGLTLYELLHRLDRFVARLMIALVIVAVAITCMNLVFQYGGVLLVTKETYLSGLIDYEHDKLILLFPGVHKVDRFGLMVGKHAYRMAYAFVSDIICWFMKVAIVSNALIMTPQYWMSSSFGSKKLKILLSLISKRICAPIEPLLTQCEGCYRRAIVFG